MFFFFFCKSRGKDQKSDGLCGMYELMMKDGVQDKSDIMMQPVLALL